MDHLLGFPPAAGLDAKATEITYSPAGTSSAVKVPSAAFAKAKYVARRKAARILGWARQAAKAAGSALSSPGGCRIGVIREPCTATSTSSTTPAGQVNLATTRQPEMVTVVVSPERI